jgi:CRISPR/Cas system-associated protein Cas5 (RAMP superfamily)
MVLMRKWEKIPDEIKKNIIDKRRNTAINRTDEERENKNRRVDEFRDRMNKYKNGFLDQERKKLAEDIEREAEFLDSIGEDFADPSEVQRHMEDMLSDHPNKPQPKRVKRIKRNPLLKLTGMDWNPNHSTLEVKRVDGRHSPFKSNYRLDEPPEDEE